MANTIKESSSFDSGGLLFFIYKWRKSLSLIALAAVLFSVVFSSPFFITPKYESSVVFYPSSAGSISRALLTERSTQRHDILDFGKDMQTEHMLQILNSGRIRNRVIEHFNLMEHYGIDTSRKYSRTRLQQEYDRNISFRRTEYMAVKISVLDRNPVMAAEIANYISILVDSVRNSMQRDMAVPGFRIVEQQFAQLQNEIRIKEDSMTVLRQMGIHEYEPQSEMLNQQLAAEVARNNQSAIRALEARLDILSKHGSAYVSLRDQLVNDYKQLSILRARLEEARVDAEQYLPFKFVVEEAVEAERKSYPIRWLIVVLSTSGALLFSSILILLIENYREMGSYLKSRQRKQQLAIFTPLDSKTKHVEKNRKI